MGKPKKESLISRNLGISFELLIGKSFWQLTTGNLKPISSPIFHRTQYPGKASGWLVIFIVRTPWMRLDTRMHSGPIYQPEPGLSSEGPKSRGET